MTSHSQFTKATEGEEVVSAFTNDIQEKTSMVSTTGYDCKEERLLNLSVLITGISPNGLGAQFAQTLASKNPSLIILAGRDREKVQTVAATLAAVHPEVTTRILTFDLTSFSSVRSAAAEVMAYPELGIDILINNAGVMNIPERTLSPEGFEMHLATNYLGSFLFTNSILDKLVNNGGARIVNVSSQGYVFSPFRFSDYNFEGKPLPESEYPAKSLCDSYGLPWGLGYLPTIAYGQSKTAMLLYSAQLAKATNAKGITTVCVHPGGKFSQSNILWSVLILWQQSLPISGVTYQRMTPSSSSPPCP